MCPSYRATRDEKDVTRGRANTLRLAISGQLGPDALTSDDMMETLKLCVSCKACRHECPTGVDMAKMKIEVLAARAEQARAVAAGPAGRLSAALCRRWRHALRRLPIGATAAHCCASCSSSSPGSARSAPCPRCAVMCSGPHERAPGPKAAARSCCSPTPSIAPTSGRISRPRCACWSTAATASICRGRWISAGRCAAGARSFRPVSSIRPAGELDRACRDLRALRRARRADHRAGAELPADAPRRIAVAAADDDAARRQCACAAVRGISGARGGSGPPATAARPGRGQGARARPLPPKVIRRIQTGRTGASPRSRSRPSKPSSSSCCGMAGAFGYGADTYQASIEMAELSSAAGGPPRRRRHLIVADGTSCRHQIRDGASTRRPPRRRACWR